MEKIPEILEEWSKSPRRRRLDLTEENVEATLDEIRPGTSRGPGAASSNSKRSRNRS